MKTVEVRQSFLDYFARNGHKVVQSGPVVPFGDPTLLFINAGMCQFKDIFTGRRKVDYKRAVTCQKCIRAGGKHNDLDNVGFTARHHTFFEMLGNFSFGDYFKEEAIYFAWEYFTKELKLPAARLYASVYEEDDEAFLLWEKIAPELKSGRILRFGKAENYWSMGEIGPCGPSSEIHFDRGEKYGTGLNDVVNGETERFVELGNLVFMQNNQQPDGTIVPLPKPSVDQGTGLERVAAVMQDVDSNYGIDLFQHLIAAISDTTGARYEDHVASHHVIADHLRALTFAIADGAGISNEGQGYVLRRILRRAAYHGRLLDVVEPFIYKLVPALVDEMGKAYPEIRDQQAHIANVIRAEEESFGRTLETGMEWFDKTVAATKGKVIAGKNVFKLYDTYGFPYDLTEIMAGEKGLSLDRDGFEKAMEAQKERSKAGGKFITVTFGVPIEWAKEEETSFFRDALVCNSKIKAVRVPEGSTEADSLVILLDKTPFYAEAGGQIGDKGTIHSPDIEIEIDDVTKQGTHYLHLGSLVTGSLEDLKKGLQVTASVDTERRRSIERNHTATHLSHAALRKVLGDHIKQSGSYVGPDRLRFDFSHHQPMTPMEIQEVEQIVNAEIIKGIVVVTKEMDIDSAKKSGAMALFGEKYEDNVRVVSVGDFSKELCGGTHVGNTGQIGPFLITTETGIASGVRRLEAITGVEAIEYMIGTKSQAQKMAQLLNRPENEAVDALLQLRDQHQALTKELKKLKAEIFSGGSKVVGTEEKKGQIILIFNDFRETDRDTMSGWIDTQKARNEAVIAIGLGRVNGKFAYMACATIAATNHGFGVDKMTKELLPKFGGRGGGKPNFAQGSVADNTDPEKLRAAAIKLIPKGE